MSGDWGETEDAEKEVVLKSRGMEMLRSGGSG